MHDFLGFALGPLFLLGCWVGSTFTLRQLRPHSGCGVSHRACDPCPPKAQRGGPAKTVTPPELAELRLLEALHIFEDALKGKSKHAISAAERNVLICRERFDTEVKKERERVMQTP